MLRRKSVRGESRSARGFTLVELNLAIIFVAMLVVGVAVVVINVTKINQRGVVLKTINQTGREVVDQLRRDITESQIDKVEYIAPVGGVGRLCLGAVSYVFNTAEALQGSGTLVQHEASGQPVALMRIDDKDGEWCRQSGGTFIKNEVMALDTAVELLQTDTVQVAVHAMDVKVLTPVAASEAQGLVSFSIVIGTNETDTLEAGACKPPTSHQSNYDGCAVREFQTVVRSNGAGKRR